MNIDDYEKLGVFYLGKTEDAPYLYKSKHLTTHAAIVGMTGSGKTGLGISMIEEAAIDGIPSIIIDPKGDMGNLLLTFPELKHEDFAEWAEDGLSENDRFAFGVKKSGEWKSGLASWYQNPDRIKKLKDSAEFSIYTPGSSAGRQVSLISGFEVPPAEILNDSDLFASVISSTVSGLLGILGIKSDPLTGQEHIFLSNIFSSNFLRGNNVTLETLISEIITPKFDKIGFMPVESFFPEQKRVPLAMKINALLANPSFGGWIQGEPLDVQNVLYTKEGKPKVSVFYIAHLSDDERMFFVSTILNKLLFWMRKQSGTSSLRAIFYMDEIFGYFPPNGEPPSKKPLLILLKQARAFGLGLVLATQNPVDIDYRGLSNIGTWMVGKLQTAQDVDRIIQGMTSTEGETSGELRKIISSLKGRTFLVKNVHESGISKFETRWVLSYLKGPLSQQEVKRLTEKSPISKVSQTVSAIFNVKEDSDISSFQPITKAGIRQVFSKKVSGDKPLEAYIMGIADISITNVVKNIDTNKTVYYRIYVGNDFQQPDWENAEEFDGGFNDKVPQGAKFYKLSSVIANLKSFADWEKSFISFVMQKDKIVIYKCQKLKMESNFGESFQSFSVRVADHIRNLRDQAVDKIEEKFVRKREIIMNKISKAQNRLQKEKADVTAKTTDSILSAGMTIFGALFGSKKLSTSTISRTAQTIKNTGRLKKEKDEVNNVEAAIVSLQKELDILDQEIQNEISNLKESYTIDMYPIEESFIPLKRSNIVNSEIIILWE